MTGAPPFLQEQRDGTYLHVKVQPRSSKDEIGDTVGNELKVRVRAPPVDAAANEALVRLLANLLDCPRSSVQLIRGQTSRHKVIFLRGLRLDTVVARLGQSQ